MRVAGQEKELTVGTNVDLCHGAFLDLHRLWLELPPLRETTALDELELNRELSDACHRTGVPEWQSLVKTILDWIAEASGAERSRRIQALNRLIKEIKVQASHLERLRSPQEQKPAEETRQQIHQLLKSFVDAFSVKSVA